MDIITKHFGKIEIIPENILDFEEGIPGLDGFKKYIILFDYENDGVVTSEIKDVENKSNLLWLQSLENQELAFVLLDTFNHFEDYDPKIIPDEIKILGEYDPETFRVYNIVVIPEDMKEMTVNLKAPIIVNLFTKKGKQVVVLNEEYGIRYKIF